MKAFRNVAAAQGGVSAVARRADLDRVALSRGLLGSGEPPLGNGDEDRCGVRREAAIRRAGVRALNDSKAVNCTDVRRLARRRRGMIRTVTLRLEQDEYDELREVAAAERRPLSNFIATAALERVRKAQFVDDGEMADVLNDDALARRLRTSFPAGWPAQERLRCVMMTGPAWSGTCVKYQRPRPSRVSRSCCGTSSAASR